VGTLEMDLFRLIDEAVSTAAEGVVPVVVGADEKPIDELTYVCEGWDRPLPKMSSSSSGKDGDVDGVTVTESVSVDERLRRTFENAKNNGSIILLSDDESDQEEAKVGKETKKRSRDGKDNHPESPGIDHSRVNESDQKEVKKDPDSPNIQQCHIKAESTDPMLIQTTMPVCPITPEATTMTLGPDSTHETPAISPTSDLTTKKRKAFFLQTKTDHTKQSTASRRNVKSYFIGSKNRSAA